MSAHFLNRIPSLQKLKPITHETKINVRKDLKESSFTYSLAAKKNNISITKVIQLFDKHVSIPRKHLLEVLYIDEHYFPASDFDSLYICILKNLRDGTIIDVLPDRKKAFLISYFGNTRYDTLDEKSGRSELSNVRYMSIDLYEPYRDIIRTHFRCTVICADVSTFLNIW